MRLSFNEIRTRAANFARTYADATYEKGETQTFYNDFFAIFGVERRSVARYEEHVRKLNNRSGFIDLFWPRVLFAVDLARVMERAMRVPQHILQVWPALALQLLQKLRGDGDAEHLRHLLGIIIAHGPTPRSACGLWPLCVALLPSPCAVCGSVSVAAWPRQSAYVPRSVAHCVAWRIALRP